MSRQHQQESFGEQAALRRCALNLHAIAREDQRWCLSRLPGIHRVELEQLLGELQALGIAPDARVVRTVLGNAGRVPMAAQESTPPCVSPLEARQAPALATLLEHEPAGLIVQVLAISASCNRATVLAHLSGPKRRQVHELLAQTAESPARTTASPQLSEALLAQLAGRLASASDAAIASKRYERSGWRGRWMRLWKRAS